MSTSSQPPDYSIDSINTITIGAAGSNQYDFSNTVIIGATGSNYQYDFSNVMSSTSISYNTLNSIGTYSISSDINTEYKINWPEEWVDAFPLWSRVEQMRKQYPALEIALRNFKTVYDLVKDDYDNPKDKK
jgi:hypothetical protein